MATQRKKITSPTVGSDEYIDVLIRRESSSLESYAISRILPPPPGSEVNVGDKVYVGNLRNGEVIRVIDEGRRVVVRAEAWRTTGDSENITEKMEEIRYMVIPWFEALKIDRSKDTHFSREPSRTDINYSQRDIEGIVNYVFHAGVDDAPMYQRGLVWTQQEKIDLIDSIFQRVDIGKFIFVENSFVQNQAYLTVLDGKQRLNAIVEFMADRFPYRGTLWSEMGQLDRSRFLGVSVACAKVSSISEKEALEIFLRINSSGRAQTPEHLEALRNELRSLQAAENNNAEETPRKGRSP